MHSTITSVNGITALGKNIGIKKEKLDFAVIYSDTPCEAAAVYTKNHVKGAPLIVTKEHLKDGKAQAIVINSGVANVCTGERGLEDARAMARLAAAELGLKEQDVLVASTGIIGHYLPMERIKEGMQGIKQELSKDSKVASAILTTDTIEKEVCIKRGNFTIGAIAKGAGMVHPNMATMLAFIATDAKLSSKALQRMLMHSTNLSFNMLTVDMDTSTSDMCILLANGKAGEVDETQFQGALDDLCKELAKKIVIDGEGATKLIQVEVKNAKNNESARTLAKAVVSSNLVKCAAYGNDPNWGRILCAMGNSSSDFDELKVQVLIGGIQIVDKGVTIGFDYDAVKSAMDVKELIITINMNAGDSSATAYGCDMTEEYIKINAHYHT
ncbi:MAG TPA: bifunctional glutamate N-acetyltransferase/amino-acid acetyltransferase ArgJ [Candidatus Nanoarchaeia archaeon]|nr:bifunctional glutamate N-acetyltransferase/amino-acid acetyltransferase ArgJ [Candidatus Nanoarchaeia archaeon]